MGPVPRKCPPRPDQGTELTRAAQWRYSMASDRASSPPEGPWFGPLRSDGRRDRGRSNGSRDWCCFGGVRNWAPRALHSAYTASMSLTRILRKLLTRSGSVGASKVTDGLSSVGPRPH